jgi:hypothetical protein
MATDGKLVIAGGSRRDGTASGEVVVISRRAIQDSVLKR